ncbi:MAG TPA: riboflavin synthase, partial [Elusimicrobiales bacterium]|nr:riboflavin synthase [Elusimicrobiales bacterium]
MFTGIIEAIGKVLALSGTRLEISVPGDWSLALGESVAVDGICLTAVRAAGGSAVFDVSRETLKRSALGSLRKGSQVNLERAMRADGRFSGHFVTGHVDGTVRLLEVKKAAGSY